MNLQTGTDCTLSSSIAADPAKGYDLQSSVRRAKDYLSGALTAMLDLGKGSGPMNHAFGLSIHNECGHVHFAPDDKKQNPENK